jgi:DNA-binding transcriptional MerR regulator
MTLRVYRATEVCEMTELQAYVLRSWEKEFPGIGVQSTPDGPRLYRQADVDQVLRIKQLVFGEGLTLSGARRRLEDVGPPKVSEAEAAEVLSTLGSGARAKLASVREGLKTLQSMLAQKPGEFVLKPPPVKPAKVAKASKPVARPQKTVAASPKRASQPTRVAARKTPDAKRRRASA